MIRFRIVVARVYADSLVARRLTRGVYCCSIRGVSRVIVIAACSGHLPGVAVTAGSRW